MRRAGTVIRPGRKGWKLALNLPAVAFAGGVLFVLIGAWTSAFATFAFGAVCAAIAGLLIPRNRV